MIELRRRVDALLGRQQRCPSGLAGRLVGEQMARQHAPETLWTISLLDLAPADRVLDVGCGAGRAIELIAARVPDGHVAGVDLSRAMVRAATRRNRRAVAAGRASVRQGDAAGLPFADGQFDKALSVHTLYFWQQPERAVAALARVLRPGGLLALTFSPGKVGEADDAGVRAMVEERVMPALRRGGFAAARVERGPDSRRYRTIAIVGAK